MARNNPHSWTTGDECQFLKSLGSHRPNFSGKPKALLLQRYLEAMPLREEWQILNRKQIEQAVCTEMGSTGRRGTR